MHMTAKDRKLAEDISDITASLTDDDAVLVRMPEAWFVSTFLPFFAGEKVHPNVNAEEWFRRVRGPFNEAIVVDQNQQELYRVPAYYEQAAILPLDGTGKAANMPSITNMLIGANRYGSMSHPDAMENVVMDEMSKRSFMFNKEVDNSATIDRWNAIFARYGKPLIQKGSATTAAAAPVAVDIARDSTDFDEF